MYIELEPCPICHKLPKTEYYNGYGYTVLCNEHFETNWFENEESAIESWNEMIAKGYDKYEH